MSKLTRSIQEIAAQNLENAAKLITDKLAVIVTDSAVGLRVAPMLESVLEMQLVHEATAIYWANLAKCSDDKLAERIEQMLEDIMEYRLLAHTPSVPVVHRALIETRRQLLILQKRLAARAE